MKINTLCIVSCMIFLLTTCNSHDLKNEGDEDVNNLEQTIIGKWKLVMLSDKMLITDWMLTEFDYSKNNIIYEFKTNNVLTVSGKSDAISNYRAHQTGDHSYKIIPRVFEMNPLSVPAAHEIKIDTTVYYLQFPTGYDIQIGPELGKSMNLFFLKIK